MSEHRADEDLNVPSFLQEGPDGSRADTADSPSTDPGMDPRAGRTGAQIIGGCLAGAREEKGISVEAVYAATRIRPALVRQIEAGELERCGGEIYARGHIRAIAQVVGLDAEALLRQYLPASPVDVSGNKNLTVPVRGKAQVRIIRPGAPRPRAEQRKDGAAGSSGKKGGGAGATGSSVKKGAAFGVAGVTAASVVTPPPSAPAARPTSPRGMKKVSGGLGSQKGANWTAAMAAVLVGLVIVAGAQMVGGHDKAADAALAKAPVPVPVAAPPPAPRPAPPVAPTGVAFKVAAVDAPSWLAVYSSDGTKLYDALLDAGAVQSFSDGRQLAVTLGNASAVHMALNGKDLGTAGGDGQVVHLTVNPAGVVSS